MSINERERQVLESIENDIASTGPKLAAMLAMFARLTAGEEMPAREGVRRALDLPRATARGQSARRVDRPAGPRRARARLRGQAAWLVWLGVAIALIAWAMTCHQGAGQGACPVARTAACQQLPVPSGRRVAELRGGQTALDQPGGHDADPLVGVL